MAKKVVEKLEADPSKTLEKLVKSGFSDII